MDGWTKILDEVGSIDIIYMDFMKAFDMVPHRRLLKNWRATESQTISESG